MKINYRQVSVLTFLSLIAMKLLALPSLLYQQSKNMSWLVALVLMIVDGIYAVLIIDLIKKNEDKNLNEFMKKTIGPVLTKIFMAILTVKFGIIFANLTKGLEFFVVDNFYENFDWPVYILPMIALTGYMSYKGIRNIARVSEVFCWTIVVGCFYIVFKAIKGVDPLTYLPMFEDGVMPLFQSGYAHLGWFGSSTFLLMLFGKIDFKDEKKQKLIFYIIFAIVFVQIIYFVFYGLFGVTSPIHNFALSDICQFTTGKTTTDELVWLVVALWVVAQTIQIAIYGYCMMLGLMYTFNINNKLFAISINDLLLLALGFIGTKTINLEQSFLSWHVPIITVVTQYILPLILIVGSWVRKSKQKGVVNEKQIKNTV